MSLKYNNTAMIFVCDTLNKCMCLTLALVTKKTEDANNLQAKTAEFTD